MALCEGPIAGVGLIWKDLAIYVSLELGLGIFPGTTPQEVWPYLSGIIHSTHLAIKARRSHGEQAITSAAPAAIGNHNFEIFGPLSGTGVNGLDADPALVIQDFLTNAQYGCGFNPASIDSGSLFTNPGSFQAYCRAMGYAFSPALVSQEQASSTLTRWLQIFSTAAVWSGGVLSSSPMRTQRSPWVTGAGHHSKQQPSRRSGATWSGCSMPVPDSSGPARRHSPPHE